MNSVLVIGKNGQLARELSAAFENVICLGRHDLDVMSVQSITEYLSRTKTYALINASAYTAVDQAESDKEAAYALNCDAVANMANACKAAGIPMVHVSTDYVFKGDKGSPYSVTDAYDPQGEYGKTKAEGEKIIRSILPDTSCIIRTSWVYSSMGNNFVKTMLKLMSSRPELTVIDDQIGSPTWAKGLAQACFEAATEKLFGVFHWSDEGVTSWYDFACAIQELGLEKGLLKSNTHIKPIPTKDYPTPATRPHYSVLDKALTRNTFNTPLTHWRNQLSNMMDELLVNES